MIWLRRCKDTKEQRPRRCSQKQKTSDSVPKAYMTGAAKEAGKQTVEHLSQSQDFQQTANNLEQNAEQKYDDAKAKAQVRSTFTSTLLAS